MIRWEKNNTVSIHSSTNRTRKKLKWELSHIFKRSKNNTKTCTSTKGMPCLLPQSVEMKWYPPIHLLIFIFLISSYMKWNGPHYSSSLFLYLLVFPECTMKGVQISKHVYFHASISWLTTLLMAMSTCRRFGRAYWASSAGISPDVMEEGGNKCRSRLRKPPIYQLTVPTNRSTTIMMRCISRSIL